MTTGSVRSSSRVVDSIGFQWRKTVHLHFRAPKNGTFKTQNIRLKPLKTNLIYYQKYKKSHNAYSNTKILKESAKLNFKHLTMTSLYNPISKCFVVLKHGIFITHPTNNDIIILQRFCQEIEETRVANPSGNCLLSYCRSRSHKN